MKKVCLVLFWSFVTPFVSFAEDAVKPLPSASSTPQQFVAPVQANAGSPQRTVLPPAVTPPTASAINKNTVQAAVPVGTKIKEPVKKFPKKVSITDVTDIEVYESISKTIMVRDASDMNVILGKIKVGEKVEVDGTAVVNNSRWLRINFLVGTKEKEGLVAASGFKKIHLNGNVSKTDVKKDEEIHVSKIIGNGHKEEDKNLLKIIELQGDVVDLIKSVKSLKDELSEIKDILNRQNSSLKYISDSIVNSAKKNIEEPSTSAKAKNNPSSVNYNELITATDETGSEIAVNGIGTAIYYEKDNTAVFKIKKGGDNSNKKKIETKSFKTIERSGFVYYFVDKKILKFNWK